MQRSAPTPRALLLLALLALGACAKRAGLPARDGTLITFATETLDGSPYEVGGRGPVRLVELWATWCDPCAPASDAARGVLARHPGVRAYAISIDAEREVVQAWVERSPAGGTPLLLRGGPSEAARQGFGRVPTFIALDRSGRVVGSVTGFSASLAPAIDRLLSRAEGRTVASGP